MELFVERLRKALRRAGKTEVERAARIGRTVRAIDEWERGKGVAPLLESLERAGVIRILDSPIEAEPPIARVAGVILIFDNPVPIPADVQINTAA